jgi:hypothetical protein
MHQLYRSTKRKKRIGYKYIFYTTYYSQSENIRQERINPATLWGKLQWQTVCLYYYRSTKRKKRKRPTPCEDGPSHC